MQKGQCDLVVVKLTFFQKKLKKNTKISETVSEHKVVVQSRISSRSLGAPTDLLQTSKSMRSYKLPRFKAFTTITRQGKLYLTNTVGVVFNQSILEEDNTYGVG